MKKLNKKGFTLIEMLVVIAIIAVLVAILIPTVTSATNKAAYATNAANLRSYKAEITTAYLSDGSVTVDATAGTVTIPATIKAPDLKGTSEFDPTATANAIGVTYESATGNFVVKAGAYTIDDFAIGASSGKIGTSHNK